MLPTCTVLLVDDFSADRELYRRWLADSKDTYGYAYQCLEAESAAAGLALCRTRVIDAILLDYILPGTNGLKFIEALSAQNQGDCPPIVMITGEGDETIAVQSLKLGAEDYLVKRCLTPERLQATMHSAIENARLRSQLRQSENRFRASVENMLDCFGIFSAMRDEAGQITDFRIDYLNAAALESNRMTVANLGQGLCELLPAHRQTGLFEAYCRVVETGEPLDQEDLIYSDQFGAQQLTRAYDVRVSKLDDGVVASWRDVTARKQSELARQQAETDRLESERRFREIFNTTYQFIGLLSPQGILLEANQAALEFGGIQHEAAVGRPFWEARWWTISPQIQQQLQDAIRRAAQGEFIRYEVEILGAGDITTIIDFSLKPVRDETGQVVLLIPEGRDIGDRVRYERDRKRMEASLQDKEERLTLAIQGAGMATWDADLQTGQAIWSEGHFRILGYEPNPTGEATVAMWQSRVHPDDQEQVWQTIEQTQRTGGMQISEHRIIRADNGETRWIRAFGRFFYNQKGEATRSVGVFFDTTESKQTELALIQSNERFELAAAAVNCIIYDWDLQRDVVERTRGLYELTGYLPEEAGSSSGWWFEQTHPEDRARKSPQEAIAELVKQERYRAEYRIRHKQGHYIWVEDWGRAIKDASGRPIRLVGSTRDISDRKRLEAYLRQSQEHIRFITDTIPQIVWTADSQGRNDYVNQRWTEYTGLTLAAAHDYGWQNLVHPEDLPQVQTFWTETYQTAPAYELEYRLRRYDGMFRWHLVKGLPLRDQQGQICKWFGSCTDIHDRKQAALERAQLLVEAQTARAEAETANRSKDEFVAVVAHELRSPLNSIAGWAKLLQTRPFDPVSQSKALETIWRNTQIQVQLVEDLLDISRMVQGSLHLNLAPVNLADVIAAALEQVQPQAEAKRIVLQSTLISSASASLGTQTLQVSGDFNRLQQVVVNLLTNAIKFTPEGGQVDLELEPLPTQAQLRVRDTGRGIAPDFLPQIFERFRQAQQQAGSKEGLGLGLAIVKNLVELHGGTITADSPGIDQGATFTLQLPLLSADSGLAGRSAEVPVSSLEGVRILVVDDEPDMLDLLTFILENEAAEVRAASTVLDALALLSQFQPDLLISDIALPDLSGYDLIQQMRLRYSEEQIPAIALTAYASTTYEERSQQSGFQAHLTKPVEPEVLVATIARLVHRFA